MKIHYCDELQAADIEGKFVFLRVDYNTPLEKKGDKVIVTDSRRIKESIPTLQFLLGKGAKVICCSHLGRPKNRDPGLSMLPIGEVLAELLGEEVIVPTETNLKDFPKLLKVNPHQKVYLLENIRYEKGEEENSPELAKVLAGLCDFYINDAFGASHRAHCSVVGIPQLLKKKSYAGFLIKKEMDYLKQVLNPKVPFCLISGGSKISDKIQSFENILPKTKILLIGGAMAYTFLKAKGKSIGQSKFEKDHVITAIRLLKMIEDLKIKLILPVDHVVADPKTFQDIETVKEIPDNKAAFDIGPETVELFSSAVQEAASLFWNGPLGFFEKKEFSAGTFKIAKAVAESHSTSIIGGGDTALAVQESGFGNKMSHISTGGGASLEFIENRGRLPGLDVLMRE